MRGLILLAAILTSAAGCDSGRGGSCDRDVDWGGAVRGLSGVEVLASAGGPVTTGSGYCWSSQMWLLSLDPSAPNVLEHCEKHVIDAAEQEGMTCASSRRGGAGGDGSTSALWFESSSESLFVVITLCNQPSRLPDRQEAYLAISSSKTAK